MAVKNNQDNKFKKWLVKKNLNYEDFSQQTGIRYHTVVGWARGQNPRSIWKSVLKQKFPDCPLVKISHS